MNFIEAVQSGFKNAFHFKGRAPRSEYNFWLLFLLIIFSFSIEIDPPTPTVVHSFNNGSEQQTMGPDHVKDPLFEPFNSRLFSFVYFVVLLPTMSLTIRRFHDIGKSGWYILLPITIIGIIPYHYWTCLIKGNRNTNLYGDNPLHLNSELLNKTSSINNNDEYDNNGEEE